MNNSVNSSTSNGKIEVYEVDIQATSVPYGDKFGFQQLNNLPNYLIIALMAAIFLLCCLNVCVLRLWKKKYYSNLHKVEERCDANCGCLRKPLLSHSKSNDSISKTSSSLSRDE